MSEAAIGVNRPTRFGFAIRERGLFAASAVTLVLLSFIPAAGFLLTLLILMYLAVTGTLRDQAENVIRWVGPLGIMALIPVILGIASRAPPAHLFRDVYYWSMFAAVLMLGILSARRIGLLDNLTLGVSILSLQFLLSFASILLFAGNADASVDELRDETGQSSTFAAVLFLPFLALLAPWLRVTFLISIMGGTLSFGRTNLITLAVLIVAPWKTALKVFVAVLLLLVGGWWLAYQPLDPLLTSLTQKLKGSVAETATDDFWSANEIHRRWRAYEVTRVKERFENADWGEKLLGAGFGARVESEINKRQDRTGQEYTREIPIFHNAYAFILLKGGVLLMAAWIAWWLAVWRRIVLESSHFLGRGYAVALAAACFLMFYSMSQSFYGYPLMRNVGVETFLLGALLGLQHEKGMRGKYV